MTYPVELENGTKFEVPDLKTDGWNRSTSHEAIAKKTGESERGAKEKEFADGQHANVINGVWHCSNCGCPESIAIGRRKGPLGDKSQCGTCGKFWHRHRRPRPVQYNSDPQHHQNLRNEELGKTNTNTRGLAASQSTPTAPPRPSTPESPRPPAMVSLSSPGGDLGSNASGAYVSAHGSDAEVIDAQTPSEQSIPVWLSGAIAMLQTKYPEDRFEAILRKSSPRAVPEWRIKCLDCPGRLYNPGPGDSLSDYEVHLKNRQHRLRVTGRVKSTSS